MESERAEVVVLQLGACRYALAMDAVTEVARSPALTRVPGLPAWVAGVSNWRGRVLAVLDLRPLLGEPVVAADRRSRLVVLAQGAVRLALLVERVEGTVPYDPAGVQPVLAHLPEASATLLAGQLTDDRGPVGLLAVAGVFALADRLPATRRVG